MNSKKITKNWSRSSIEWEWVNKLLSMLVSHKLEPITSRKAKPAKLWWEWNRFFQTLSSKWSKLLAILPFVNWRYPVQEKEVRKKLANRVPREPLANLFLWISKSIKYQGNLRWSKFICWMPTNTGRSSWKLYWRRKKGYKLLSKEKINKPRKFWSTSSACSNSENFNTTRNKIASYHYG